MTTLVPVRRPPTSWQRSFGRARRYYDAVLAHPDGRRLIAADTDGSATVWNLDDGRAHRLASALSGQDLEGARGVSLVLHPDAKLLFATVTIVGGGDVTHAWNVDTGHLVDRYDTLVPRHFIGDHEALSADGLYLTWWDLRTGGMSRRLLREDVSWRVLGVTGEYALVEGRHEMEVWDLRNRRLRWSAPAYAAALWGECVVLATPGALALRALDGTEVQQFALGELVGANIEWRLAVGGDTVVVAGAGPELVAIELTTGHVRARLPGAEHARVRITADHAIISQLDRSSAVWSLATGSCRLRAPCELALSPTATRAYGCDGANVREWLVDGREQDTQQASWQSVTVVTVPDVIVGRDHAGTIHVTDHDGVERHRWSPAPGTEHAGARLVHVERATTIVRDALTGVPAFEVPGPASWAVLSPDGSLLATVHDGVSVWRLGEDAAEPISTLQARRPGPTVLALTETRVALAVDHSIELWRVSPPLRLHTFRSITAATCAAFDTELRWLVSGHGDGAILVRDIVRRDHHGTISTGDHPVHRLALHEAHAAVICNGVLALWDLETRTQLAEWGDEHALDVAWLDRETLACATRAGLVILRR